LPAFAFALVLTACASARPGISGPTVYKQLDDHLRQDQAALGACLATPSGNQVNALVIELVESAVKSFAVSPATSETEPARVCLEPVVRAWYFNPPAPARVELTISTEPFHAR
jgi:hypothetical protein